MASHWRVHAAAAAAGLRALASQTQHWSAGLAARAALLWSMSAGARPLHMPQAEWAESPGSRQASRHRALQEEEEEDRSISRGNACMKRTYAHGRNAAAQHFICMPNADKQHGPGAATRSLSVVYPVGAPLDLACAYYLRLLYNEFYIDYCNPRTRIKNSKRHNIYTF